MGLPRHRTARELAGQPNGAPTRRALPDLEAFSIKGFCHAYNLSRAGLYRLLAAGLAPKIRKVGGRRLISRESAAEWRRAMEERS